MPTALGVMIESAVLGWRVQLAIQDCMDWKPLAQAVDNYLGYLEVVSLLGVALCPLLNMLYK